MHWPLQRRDTDELVQAIPGILDSIDSAEMDREASKTQSGPRLSSKERKRMRKERLTMLMKRAKTKTEKE